MTQWIVLFENILAVFSTEIKKETSTKMYTPF